MRRVREGGARGAKRRVAGRDGKPTGTARREEALDLTCMQDPNHSAFNAVDEVPDESRMVKKFRRAAAGLEEQLPSDLRPPTVLKKTCDYLFDEVIGGASSLAKVHHFVWDRTRAVRNDFSIQQVTNSDDLRIAVECYERIARFHIVSLHQLALPQRPYSKYDWQQEREQLDKTLLSLMQYYDDSKGRIGLSNEAEFRAYCVVFQLQDPTPNLEDRIQSWPKAVLTDQRVRKALEIYMAANNSMDVQGPLKPAVNHLIARQDWQGFWNLIASEETSYLTACVAEIHFNLVRRTVINALFRTFRANLSVQTPEWTLDVLCNLLAFDEVEEVSAYCARFGFGFKQDDSGEQYLDLSSIPGRTLPEPDAGMPRQSKSGLVEVKRMGRSLPAVIRGLSVKEAQDSGEMAQEEEEPQKEDGDAESVVIDAPLESEDDLDSLFIPEKPAFASGTREPPRSTFTFGTPSPPSQTQPPPTTTTQSSRPFPPAQISFGSPSAAPSKAPDPVLEPQPPPTTTTQSSRPFPPAQISFGSPSAAPSKASDPVSEPQLPPTTTTQSSRPFPPAQISFGSPSAAPSKAPDPVLEPQPPPTHTTQSTLPNSPAKNLANSSSANGAYRKPSFSTDTRPKKPSPLSNSFTASDDSGTVQKHLKPPTTGLSGEKPPSPTTRQPAEASKMPPSKVESDESIDAKAEILANCLYTDHVSGLLRQFIEFEVSNIVSRVYTQLLEDQRREDRVRYIRRKYFALWKEIAWRKMVAAAGRQRRERRQKRLREGFSESTAQDNSTASIEWTPPLEKLKYRVRSGEVETLYRQTVGHKSFEPPPRSAETAGNKRPASSGAEAGRSLQESNHKRLKSTSRVDERGRVAKPTPAKDPQADILERSSFLGFSMPASAPNSRNTTRSNYFRYKAMGLHRAKELAATHGTKKPHPQSTQALQTSSPTSRLSLHGSSGEPSASKALESADSVRPEPQRTRDEDAALFARMKAAREALNQSSTLMRSEMGRDESWRSLGASQSSNNSPSQVRARIEARMRASQGTSPARNVPAYRLRQSKFVPQEHYTKAIEKAQAIRQSRSRETSRPESRAGHSTGHVAPNELFTFDSTQRSLAPAVEADGPHHTLRTGAKPLDDSFPDANDGDHTVRATQIDESLRNSFGPPSKLSSQASQSMPSHNGPTGSVPFHAWNGEGNDGPSRQFPNGLTMDDFLAGNAVRDDCELPHEPSENGGIDTTEQGDFESQRYDDEEDEEDDDDDAGRHEEDLSDYQSEFDLQSNGFLFAKDESDHGDWDESDEPVNEPVNRYVGCVANPMPAPRYGGRVANPMPAPNPELQHVGHAAAPIEIDSD